MMYKRILLLISICICFIISCKKDVKCSIAAAPYKLNMVKLEYLDANDSIYFGGGLIPISNKINIFDAISSYDHTVSVAGDSLNFRSFDYSSGGPHQASIYAIINKKPTSDSTHTVSVSAGQHGYTVSTTKYFYIDNELDIVNYFYDDYNGITPNHNYDISKAKFNYLNNQLISFTRNTIWYSENGTDSTLRDTLINIENTYSFNYSANLSNQKKLIGIDLNDLFLTTILTGNLNGTGGIFNSPSIMLNPALSLYESFAIVNSLLSFNTNNSKLIEGVQFDRVGSNSMESITAQYTFDADKNNRVKTMKITTVTGSSVRYTFYYTN